MINEEKFAYLYRNHYESLKRVLHHLKLGNEGERAALEEYVLHEVFLIALVMYEVIYKLEILVSEWLMLIMKQVLRKTLMERLEQRASVEPQKFWEKHGLKPLCEDSWLLEKKMLAMRFDQGHHIVEIAQSLKITPEQCRNQIEKLSNLLRHDSEGVRREKEIKFYQAFMETPDQDMHCLYLVYQAKMLEEFDPTLMSTSASYQSFLKRYSILFWSFREQQKYLKKPKQNIVTRILQAVKRA